MGKRKMIYDSIVRVKYKKTAKAKDWIERELNTVSVCKTPMEFNSTPRALEGLKEMVFDKKSVGFKTKGNFVVVEIKEKKAISESFYYYD